MGWTYACDPRFDRKAQIEMFRRPGGLLGPGYTLLRSSVVGNNFWYLYSNPDNVITIGLCLMKGGGRGMGWGYKGMDETWGPVELNCPLKYLSLASAPRGHAVEWRERVRAYHAAKRARPKLKAGMRVRYGPQCYTLVEVHWRGARHGWWVTGDDGKDYRMRAHQLAKSEVLT